LQIKQDNGKKLLPLPLIFRLLDQFEQGKIYMKINLQITYNLIYIKEGEIWEFTFQIKHGWFYPSRVF